MISDRDYERFPNIERIIDSSNIAEKVITLIPSYKPNIYIYDCANLISYIKDINERLKSLNTFMINNTRRDPNGIHIYVHNIPDKFEYYKKDNQIIIGTMQRYSYDDMIIIFLTYLLGRLNYNITIYTEDDYTSAHDNYLIDKYDKQLSLLDYLYIVAYNNFNYTFRFDNYDNYINFVKYIMKNRKTAIALGNSIIMDNDKLKKREARFADENDENKENKLNNQNEIKRQRILLGGDPDYIKYIKYKTKYLKLKKQLKQLDNN
jgi:hypothetical protein